jgi:hypothetical protein
MAAELGADSLDAAVLNCGIEGSTNRPGAGAR